MIKIKTNFSNGYRLSLIPYEAVEVFEVRYDISGDAQQFRIVTKSGQEYNGVINAVENFDKVLKKFGG